MKPISRPLAAASLALLLSACAPHAAPPPGPSGPGESAAASEAPVSPDPTPSPDIRDSSAPPAPSFPGPSSIPSANPSAVSSKVTYPTIPPMPHFYYAESVEELVEWISTAREDDPRRHFLDIARQYEALPVIHHITVVLGRNINSSGMKIHYRMVCTTMTIFHLICLKAVGQCHQLMPPNRLQRLEYLTQTACGSPQ